MGNMNTEYELLASCAPRGMSSELQWSGPGLGVTEVLMATVYIVSLLCTSGPLCRDGRWGEVQKE